MQKPTKTPQAWLRFFLLTLATCLALQTLLTIAHEHAHSTAAWLLGYTRTPFTVIWGNPITMRGWDEGVPYDQLFPFGSHPAEAVIGGIPLLMHVVFVIIGLFLLQQPSSTRRRPWFYAIYWFVVINLAELVAYLLMRPFAGSGDTGRFNEGLHLSPWVLFLAGTAFLLVAFSIVLRKVMPTLDAVAGGSRMEHRTVVWLTAFLLFLWGSGLRILSLYPDRQWTFGLIGLFAFPAWILADHLHSPPHPAPALMRP